MKNAYRMEIGIRREGVRILLKEKVEIEEKVMKDILLTIETYGSVAIRNVARTLNLVKDNIIESIEIRED